MNTSNLSMSEDDGVSFSMSKSITLYFFPADIIHAMSIFSARKGQNQFTLHNDFHGHVYNSKITHSS